MEKRYFALGLFILAFLLFFNYASAQLDSGIDESGFEEEADRILNATKPLREITQEGRWEYLGEQWKELLLKNKAVSAVDAGFKRLNFLFFFFLGQDYELSLTLVFVFLLWVFFFTMFGKIVSNFSTFNPNVSYILAFCMATILAHLKAYKMISLVLFNIIFFREGVWGWIFLVLFFALYFIVLIFINRIIWKLGRLTKRTKEEQENLEIFFTMKQQDL